MDLPCRDAADSTEDGVDRHESAGIRIYDPLNKAQRQVRLMQMLYDGGTEIKCRLKTFSLDDDPEYTALSYCWTKADPTCRIELSGAEFWVRPNLFAYLELIHKEHQTGWIFIDALCINQQDPVERGHQVMLMGDVYGKALEVVVWLGSDSLDNEVALSIFQAECLTQTGTEKLLSGISAERGPNACNRLFMHVFIKREYWSRVWIVQEILLARSLRFRYKTLVLEEDQLRAWLEHFVKPAATFWPERFSDWIDMSPWLAGQQKEANRLAHRVFLKRIKPDSEQGFHFMTLADVVGVFSERECTEPYDKIYGLLGLTKSRIKVDYSMSKTELYLRVLAEGFISWTREGLGDRNELLRVILLVFGSLLKNLCLTPYEPALVLTSEKLIELCGIPKSFYWDVLLLWESFHEHDQGLRGKKRAYHRALLQYGTVQSYLRHYQKSLETPLPECDTNGRQIWGTWERMTEKIFREVESQMQIYETEA